MILDAVVQDNAILDRGNLGQCEPVLERLQASSSWQPRLFCFSQ
jgi:hypothetical protein